MTGHDWFDDWDDEDDSDNRCPECGEPVPPDHLETDSGVCITCEDRLDEGDYL